jgi:hypothetical protein
MYSPVAGGFKWATLGLRLRSLKIEKVKYGYEFYGLRPQKDCAGKVQQLL